MNIFESIDQHSLNIALIGRNGFRLSYEQLVNQTERVGCFVEPRSLVFLVCDDSAECVVVYLSMMRRGAVIALLNNGVRPTMLRSLMQSYSPDYILLPERRSQELSNCRNVANQGRYAFFKTEYAHESRLNDELCLLLATSGSTGSPKFVRLSYQNIKSNAHAIASYLNITSDDRAIVTMPISYTYGLSIIHTHLLYGASLVIPETSLLTRRFWSLFAEEEATTFGGVPYIFHMLDRLNFYVKELPTLQYITQAGGKLEKSLAEKFIRYCTNRGLRLITMYGQTEASPRISYLPWEFVNKKQGSIGKPIPGGALWLEDESGNQLNSSFSHGEIVYEGPNVMMGYAYSRDDLELGDEMKGVLHTGDIGYRDNDDFYYISGRKSRFIKLFGFRVSLDEVEELLKNEGYECACVGEDEKMRIYITEATINDNIEKLLEERTGINKAGYTVCCIDKIPTHSSGKTAYSTLR